MEKFGVRNAKLLSALVMGIIALTLITVSCSKKPTATTTFPPTGQTTPAGTTTNTTTTTAATTSATTQVTTPTITTPPVTTTTPAITTTTTTTTTTPATGAINLVASSLAFNMGTITVTRGVEVTVNFTNQDSGLAHNFAVYTNSGAGTVIFRGDTISSGSIVYKFTAPSTPGTYFFRCDLHPLTMTGSFIVQ